MTRDELSAIRARCEAATPGPWYPRATDDNMHMNARYVSTHRGVGWRHDQQQAMAEPTDSESVIAITLLQSPRLAMVDECDENTLFIAHAREDVPALLDEVERLQAALAIVRSRAEGDEK